MAEALRGTDRPQRWECPIPPGALQGGAPSSGASGATPRAVLGRSLHVGPAPGAQSRLQGHGRGTAHPPAMPLPTTCFLPGCPLAGSAWTAPCSSWWHRPWGPVCAERLPLSPRGCLWSPLFHAASSSQAGAHTQSHRGELGGGAGAARRGTGRRPCSSAQVSRASELLVQTSRGGWGQRLVQKPSGRQGMEDPPPA